MLMTNAAKGLRRGISNVDLNVISPSIGSCFTNEMLYNPDKSIKGDSVVVPRGAAAILIRESAQQRRIQFLSMTANPIDAAIITPKHRAVVLRDTAASMELPDGAVPSEEELEQSQQAQSQIAQQQLQQQQQAEIGRLTLEHKFKLEEISTKESAIAGREGDAQKHRMLADVVKAAVDAAMTKAQEKTGGLKKVKYNYDDAGELVGTETQ